MSELFTALYESPIGALEIVAVDEGITAVNFVSKGRGRRPDRAAAGRAGVLETCLNQLEEYFQGRRTSFSLPLRLKGTPFQKKVWEALLRIPYGRTTTYGAIATALGNRSATRAVGGANHRNPVSIIVPCHRVVGSDGRLTGYGGGLWRKEWLLAHEHEYARE
jgi:methylated-DNA-[protein]-cysteine S-methyltransferase